MSDTKRGRGRPKGGKSFVNVKMSDLDNLFGKQQNIPVSRVWLEKLNISVETKTQSIKEENNSASSEAIPMELKN